MTLTPTDAAEPGPLMAPGTEVEVLTCFEGNWAAGFEIASTDGSRYRLRRRSDRVVLPATFAPRQVRENS